ncbi:MAG: hypothetical protein JWR50_58 [Mucilaginibacter sp.]|nr:hypothetical protein [Mucilaginibacter sp.]
MLVRYILQSKLKTCLSLVEVNNAFFCKKLTEYDGYASAIAF